MQGECDDENDATSYANSHTKNYANNHARRHNESDYFMVDNRVANGFSHGLLKPNDQHAR